MSQIFNCMNYTTVGEEIFVGFYFREWPKIIFRGNLILRISITETFTES